jgi:hypothetical protein
VTTASPTSSSSPSSSTSFQLQRDPNPLQTAVDFREHEMQMNMMANEYGEQERISEEQQEV